MKVLQLLRQYIYPNFLKFWGNVNDLNLKHIIIDEAQDLGEIQFYIFKEILHPNVSTTILGDIAQGIYSYK